MDLHEKASAALSYFHAGERESADTGRTIRIVPHGDDAPKWLGELCREAHGSFMPDDFRYEFIEEALQWLADENDADDYNPEPAIYNAERLRWLASHLERAGYCDEAKREFGGLDCGPGQPDIIEDISRGMWWEMRETYEMVRAWLENYDEPMERRAKP